MTLFTTLLVLIAERLFKLGEHWQLDHRLEVAFRRIKHFSLPGTLLMTLVAVAVVYIIQRLLQGQLFNIPLLVFWILLGLLCIGAGKVRLHYHAYLKAASRNDSRACDAMASELTLIHGVPPGCDEREYLSELQNALLWINYRYYLAPLFWFVVGGRLGPADAYRLQRTARLADMAGALPDAAPPVAVRDRWYPAYCGLAAGASGGGGLCPGGPW
ncbi:hypothetical protein AI2893V1_4062 [Klebsiella pneumoniae]|uniref:AmpE protein n=1 Tax=Klebsiella pneumoniae TaxID=573 RepID=A0A378CFI0_KLEPN|nr:hypothetical protein AI2893V1_4062 [Klebsiella pneumoniae]STV69902.1 AmpE protein [Klebsiella pneumoniae]VTN30585.1 AmpE protein [Klebsiella pneumoniae]